MKLYVDGILFSNVPRGRWKRLVGINIVRKEKWIDVEPIYRAPVQIANCGRYIMIDLGRETARYAMILQLAWPPVQIFAIPQEKVYEEYV